MTAAELPDVDVLVFDVLGTLLDEDAGQLRAVQEVLGAEAAEEFTGRWQGVFATALDDVRAGRRQYAIAEDLYAEALDEVGGGPAELVTFGRRLDPFPDVPAAFERLAARFSLVALTNAGAAQAFAMSAHAALRWTALLSGQQVPGYKPDPRVYRFGLEFLGLDPARVLFVAAHPWDLDGAAEQGYRTAYVDRESSSAAVLDGFARRFDVAAADLGDLADRLGA